MRASWRRQGIGRELHDLILAGRPEERATLIVRPAATAAQHAFRAWGWRKVARAQAGPDAPVADVLVIALGLAAPPRRGRRCGRAASRTSSAATASRGSTGSAPSPRTARAKAE